MPYEVGDIFTIVIDSENVTLVQNLEMLYEGTNANTSNLYQPLFRITRKGTHIKNISYTYLALGPQGVVGCMGCTGPTG